MIRPTGLGQPSANPYDVLGNMDTEEAEIPAPPEYASEEDNGSNVSSVHNSQVETPEGKGTTEGKRAEGKGNTERKRTDRKVADGKDAATGSEGDGKRVEDGKRPPVQVNTDPLPPKAEETATKSRFYFKNAILDISEWRTPKKNDGVPLWKKFITCLIRNTGMLICGILLIIEFVVRCIFDVLAAICRKFKECCCSPTNRT